MLLKAAPRVGGQALHHDGETAVDAAVRLCAHLDGGVLPIQGPPGAGKTFTGAHMICELVRLGMTVGITANSHKVIRNLINEAIKLADEKGIDLHCCQKLDEIEDPQPRLSFAKRSEDLDAALGTSAQVGGGTAWHWTREEVFERVDVLFVDQAAQMCLADVVAVSQAARTLVLIGDPQQLDQPRQGSHPDGTDVSALDHILAGERGVEDGRKLQARHAGGQNCAGMQLPEWHRLPAQLWKQQCVLQIFFGIIVARLVGERRVSQYIWDFEFSAVVGQRMLHLERCGRIDNDISFAHAIEYWLKDISFQIAGQARRVRYCSAEATVKCACLCPWIVRGDKVCESDCLGATPRGPPNGHRRLLPGCTVS